MDDPNTLLAAARDAHRQGDLTTAEQQYTEVLRRDPIHARAEAGLGVIALQRGRIEEALRRLEAAAARAPGDAAIQNNLGNACMAAGRVAPAEAAFDKAVAADPALTDARYNRAVARQHLRRTADAEADYRALLSVDPKRLDAAVNLAALYRSLEDPGRGIAVLESGLAAAGDAPEALLALAALYETVGRTEEAEAALQKLPATHADDPQAVLTRARLQLRAGSGEAGLAELDRLPADAPTPARRQALAVRALLLDRLGRTAEAFAGFEAANAAMRASRPDADAMAARYRHRIEAYRTHLSAPPNQPPPAAPLPFGLVFFCGFPRSGTTLMEQILDAHPATATTGEDSPLHRLYETLPPPPAWRNDHAEAFEALSAAERDALRARFVEIVTATRGELSGRCLIDKLPLNLIELGIVARLFPEAKVLVAIRDPRDCVLSAFMQPFRLNDAMACLTTLEDAARTYADVFSLYTAQRETLGLPIHEYRYEDLIDEFDSTVRGAVDFLGLPWEESVADYRDGLAGRYIATPSYMAVTQGLTRRAIGRWRRYAAQMAAVEETLAPWVTAHGYDG